MGQPAAPADRARLVDLVSSQAGIAPRDAATRVDRMQAEIKAKVERAANYARKAASYAALWLTLSLVLGAITAAMAARRRRSSIHHVILDGVVGFAPAWAASL